MSRQSGPIHLIRAIPEHQASKSGPAVSGWGGLTGWGGIHFTCEFDGHPPCQIDQIQIQNVLM